MLLKSPKVASGGAEGKASGTKRKGGRQGRASAEKAAKRRRMGRGHPQDRGHCSTRPAVHPVQHPGMPAVPEPQVWPMSGILASLAHLQRGYQWHDRLAGSSLANLS